MLVSLFVILGQLLWLLTMLVQAVIHVVVVVISKLIR
jgi:hypothetical protein